MVRQTKFVLGKVVLPAALPAEQRLLHAAFTVVLSDYPAKWTPRRDLAEMVLSGNHDVDRSFIHLAQRSQCTAVLATAIAETWDVLALADITALTTWAGRFRISKRDKNLLNLYRRPDAPYSALALRSLPYLPSMSERVAFVSSMAFPSREFLSNRGMSLPRYLWRGSRRSLRKPRND